MGHLKRIARFLSLLALAIVPLTSPAQATDDRSGGSDSPRPLETVTVIGVTPFHGLDLPADKVAGNIQQATAAEIERLHGADLSEFMNRRLGSVFINEAQGNPLQPDVQFRGFVASPLLGQSQGISVYQSGVRINDPFGDTVNWALVPESAIASIDLIPGSNPLFGLNALGGALSIRTKSGFTAPGTRAEIQGGSFERAVAEVESGGSFNDRLSYYGSARYLDEDGWRQFSPSRAMHLFGDVGWRGETGSVSANVTWVDTDLIGNGPAPIELLEIDRSAIFTSPDRTENALALAIVTGTWRWTENVSLDGVAYFRRSDIQTLNGDDSDFEACEQDPRFVCEETEPGDEEEIALDEDWNPILFSDAVDGATVNRSVTDQDGYGASLLLGVTKDIFGRANWLAVGATCDWSDTIFDSSTELGRLDESRAAVSSGIFVGELFVRVNSETRNRSVFVSETLAVTPALGLTLSGRYNSTTVELRDQIGTELNGSHDFSRFNGSAGLTWTVSPAAGFYATYGESNRAPSPVELTCANPDDPCRLPNAFLSDPPLDQVVARTIEAGARGLWRGMDWHVGLFQTTNENDIIFISAGALTNQGFFDNVGDTRRLGAEASLTGRSFDERLLWALHYTRLDATFRDSFSVTSPNNPAAIDGEVPVPAGSRIPGVPEDLLKLSADFAFTPRLSLGADLLYQSEQFLRGDEGNLLDPLHGYTVVNVGAEYRFNRNFMVFARIDNVFDAEYETFGLLGAADEVLGDGFEDPRFVSPAAPISGWIGLQWTL
jgi:outer membrane receptor protein involved in Fe transport